MGHCPSIALELDANSKGRSTTMYYETWSYYLLVGSTVDSFDSMFAFFVLFPPSARPLDPRPRRGTPSRPLPLY